MCLFALAARLTAQNIVGTWQGSLLPQGKPVRLVVKISRAEDEKLKAVLYSIDQGGQPFTASAATLQGSTLKLTIAPIGAEYEGKLNAGGDTIEGTWKQGPQPAPLNLTRATAESAWAIPEPAPPQKPMPLDAKPVFDVATIKLSRPDARGTSILVGRGGANLFTTTNTSLKDLIIFAYGLHARQLSGGSAWVENDKFDVTGKPDQPGLPGVTQLQGMVQKLLVERFGLTFHKEKKELSVYAITIAKTGLKLSKAENGGSLPGFGARGLGNIVVRNSTMADFAGFVQSRMVDRPVVDLTSLPDRYDFTLRWTPDVAQAPAGTPGATVPAAPEADAPPDLFAAFQQQLGLKLEATKAPVEVMVIDKVAKPSEN